MAKRALNPNEALQKRSSVTCHAMLVSNPGKGLAPCYVLELGMSLPGFDRAFLVVSPGLTAQRKRFQKGNLSEHWTRYYGNLFDLDDARLAGSQRTHTHFYEWLAAIIFFEMYGYCSLVEKYQFGNHPRKVETLDKLVSSDSMRSNVRDFMRSLHKRGTGQKERARGAQCPDLLLYRPDFKDYLFCEVKGPTDKHRPAQEEVFRKLKKTSRKPIWTLSFAAF